MIPVILTTFREAIRNRVLYLLLFFGVVIVLLSRIAGLLTVGDPMKVIQDLSLTVVTMIDILLAVFVGIELVYKEIERRTLFLILTKPITRNQFLFGKFIGLYGTILVVHLLMSVLMIGYIAALGHWNPRLIVALYAVMLEVLVVTGVATMFSTWTTPIISGLFTLSVWVIGRGARSLLALAEIVRKKSVLLAHVFEGLYYMLPDLGRLNLQTYAVHGTPLPQGYLAVVTLSAVLYTLIMLILASIIFNRRDFA